MSIISYFGSACSSVTGVDCSNTGLPQVHAGSSQLQSILSIIFAVLAAVAVLFIVIASLRMVTAQGDPQQVSKARSTIVYALIGLMVAILAEAIVAFTLGHLG